jgi:hypothetical protein
VYARYASRIAALASMLNFTKRLWCPLIAVPANQLHLFDGNVVKIAVDNLFLNTHIAADNYFYHGYMYGSYSRECCPRYLKEENFAALKAAVGRVEVRTGTLQEVAASYPDGTFSRYILLDHMDWMPMSMVLDEWAVFVRKARSDVRFLWRSFAAELHIAPLKYLEFHPDNVRAALSMYPDRVAMYNSTHLATLRPGFTVVPRAAYAPPATLRDDLNVLFHNWLHPISGGDHQSRLESFYAGQATSYDSFRHRFLHGRVPMIEAMPTPVGGVWVDLGGGTAANLEHLTGAIDAGVFSKVVVLDLCRPLIDVARQRVEAHGWGGKVELVVGDATDPATPGLPAPGTVDVITMSYSLTMIPDWQAALRNVSQRRRAARRWRCWRRADWREEGRGPSVVSLSSSVCDLAPAKRRPACPFPRFSSAAAAGVRPTEAGRLLRHLRLHRHAAALAPDAHHVARHLQGGRRAAVRAAPGRAAADVLGGALPGGLRRLPVRAPVAGALLFFRGPEGGGHGVRKRGTTEAGGRHHLHDYHTIPPTR